MSDVDLITDYESAKLKESAYTLRFYAWSAKGHIQYFDCAQRGLSETV